MNGKRDTPRGPSATELHTRAIQVAIGRATRSPLPASVAWRHSIYCAIHDGRACTCKGDAA